jgi:hypothetical protein
LYDLSSSYFEGRCCPLGKLGYSRDGKRGKLQVNYGLLTDRRGCPVAVSVYEGNVADAATLAPQVLRLKQDFGLDQVVLVGDRGMIGQAAVAALRTHAGLAWITALKSSQIRALVQGEAVQLGLFDERNLFEFTHPDFELTIEANRLDYRLLDESVAAEAALDGLYVIRTAVAPERMDAAEVVRGYKRLTEVERAFRSLKTVDLQIRPIHHRLENRVRAHIFLCMLSYYVEWHLREAWRELLFADEQRDAKDLRDPVAPAQRSQAAHRKTATHRLDNGLAVHSFRTLIAELASAVRNTCRTRGSHTTAPTFQIVTTLNPTQRRALDLLQAITV